LHNTFSVVVLPITVLEKKSSTNNVIENLAARVASSWPTGTWILTIN
jgi:hypothetical protein